MYSVYIKPGLHQVEVLNQEIKTARDTLDTQKKEIEFSLNQLKEKWDKVDEKDVNRLHRLIPKYANFDEVGFINHINNIAKGHGMYVNNLQFSSQPMDSVEGDYGEFTMSFTVEGGYREFRAFLDDIEHNEQVLDVDKLSFQAKGQDNYGYRISLVTYWLK